MSFLANMKHRSFTFVLICFFSLGSIGKADDFEPETGAAGGLANQYLPHGKDADEDQHHVGTAGQEEDPAHIVNKALLCFDDKNIYSSCEESYRLSVSGYLHVPPEYTNEYCEGPCSKETHLVLSCIEGVLSHFLFYNKATISEVRETIKTGCSFGSKRGDFNVQEHIEAHEDSAQRASYTIFYGLLSMVMTWCLFL